MDLFPLELLQRRPCSGDATQNGTHGTNRMVHTILQTMVHIPTSVFCQPFQSSEQSLHHDLVTMGLHGHTCELQLSSPDHLANPITLWVSQ